MASENGRNSGAKRKLKARLFGGRAAAKCCFCQRPLTMTTATLEHVVPLAEEGDWSIGNLRLSCDGCNQDRGTQDFAEFKEKARRRCPSSIC